MRRIPVPLARAATIAATLSASVSSSLRRPSWKTQSRIAGGQSSCGRLGFGNYVLSIAWACPAVLYRELRFVRELTPKGTFSF